MILNLFFICAPDATASATATAPTNSDGTARVESARLLRAGIGNGDGTARVESARSLRTGRGNTSLADAVVSDFNGFSGLDSAEPKPIALDRTPNRLAAPEDAHVIKLAKGVNDCGSERSRDRGDSGTTAQSRWHSRDELAHVLRNPE